MGHALNKILKDMINRYKVYSLANLVVYPITLAFRLIFMSRPFT